MLSSGARISGSKENIVVLNYVVSLFGLSVSYLQDHNQKLILEQLALAEELAKRPALQPGIRIFALKTAGEIARLILHEPHKALDFYTQALRISETTHDESSRAQLLTAIGSSKEELGDRETALESFMQSIDIWERLKDQAQVQELEAGISIKAADTDEAKASKPISYSELTERLGFELLPGIQVKD
jgi:tetratricopeptide (TPR) repeat protein